MDGITITCAHCGAQTDFDKAVEGLPMDHFRCTGCSRIWKRCHGTPKLCEAGGFWLPGSVTIKEVRACVRQRQGVGALPGVRA